MAGGEKAKLEEPSCTLPQLVQVNANIPGIRGLLLMSSYMAYYD